VTHQPEHVIQTNVRIALGELDDVVLWRNHTGVTQGDERVRRYGLCVGSSDLVGILSPSGRFIAIEVKSDSGRTTKEQELFLALVRRMGGFACVVRSVDDALQAVARARAGASE
jgi:VRR-NUC domain